MRYLKLISIFSATLVLSTSCVDPGGKKKLTKIQKQSDSTSSTSAEQSSSSSANNVNSNQTPPANNNDTHDNNTGPQQTTMLPVQFLTSESNISMELSQTKLIPITLSASSFFQSSNVDIDIDTSSFENFEMNNSQYIQVTLDRSRVFVNANSSVNLVMRVEVNSMAPSISSVSSGGNGKIVLRASSETYGGGVTQDFQFNFEVKPNLTIGIVSDSVPHNYDQPNQIYTRSHSAGVQVTFVNKTMNFGLNGDGPCIHTTSPLRHCNTGNRMSPGESYTPSVRVLPSSGYRRAIFYNHFNGSDNIGRYIHFNVTPGDEGV